MFYDSLRSQGRQGLLESVERHVALGGTRVSRVEGNRHLNAPRHCLRPGAGLGRDADCPTRGSLARVRV
jgi:hypothetical protein